MSHKIIQRSNCSRSPFPRQKSPVYLSPKSKPKQPQIHFNHTPINPNQFSSSNQPTNRNPQQLPLQFSANRKTKSRHPPPFNGMTNFINQPYPYPQNNNNHNCQNIHGRPQHQNKSFDSLDCSFGEISKIKMYYENQLKKMLQKNKNIQADYQLKCINLQRQKIYWRQSYGIVKEEFQSYKKSIQSIQADNNKETQLSKGLGTKIGVNFEEIIRNLQQKIEKHENYVKITENQVYNLNKQKAKLSYQLQFLKEQTRKANAHIHQLQYILQMERKQSRQQKQKSKKQQDDTSLVKSLDIKSNKLGDLTLSFESISSGQQLESTKRSNSGSKSRSSSSCSPTSLSISGGSSRHKSKHRSSSSHSSHRPPHQQTNPLQLNFDMNKQIQRYRHICRKLQKTLIHQNTSIVTQGLKNLNNKYRKVYQQQDQDEKKLSQISTNTDENKRTKEPVYFKFPCMNIESKGKITSIKYI